MMESSAYWGILMGLWFGAGLAMLLLNFHSELPTIRKLRIILQRCAWYSYWDTESKPSFMSREQV